MYVKPLKRQSFEGPEETLWNFKERKNKVIQGDLKKTYPIVPFFAKEKFHLKKDLLLSLFAKEKFHSGTLE